MRKAGFGILKVLLPIIFIGYVAVISLCVHVHVIGGRVIVHAHPFKTAQGNPFHTHTSGAFQVLSVVSAMLAAADTGVHFSFAPWRLWIGVLLAGSIANDYAHAVSGVLHLRPPPFF